MGLAESALILLGIGIVSSRFKAGVGLGELGVGIQTLVAAPLMGTGTGLSSLAGGLRDVFETFGDLGRGLSTLFEIIPAVPGVPLPGPADPYNGLPPPPPYTGTGLLTVSGGDQTTQLAGGGGNVPKIYNHILVPPYTPSPAPQPTEDPTVNVPTGSYGGQKGLYLI